MGLLESVTPTRERTLRAALRDADCRRLLRLSQTTQRVYDRVVDGIASVLLTLKKRPVIRYSQTCVPRAWRAEATGVLTRAQVRDGEAHRAGRAPPHIRAGAPILPRKVVASRG